MLLYKKCPHCRRKIRCKDLAGMKERVQVCRHCKKQYELHKGYRVIPVVIACILMICFNLLMFHMSKDMNKTTFIIMVKRGDKKIVPRGSTVLQEGDCVYMYKKA